jgi:hypothetical protein
VLLQAHRLAMKLGCPDVAAMLDGMSAPQMWHWFALNNIDPWIDERADMRAAIVASVIANTSGRKSYKVTDFMPDWGGSNKVTDPNAMATMLSGMFEAKS